MDICIFGDSITWGRGDTDNGGWADMLKDDLAKELNGKLSEKFIYNLGIPGDTTKDLLGRFPVEAQTREPEAIVFAIGINDTRKKEQNGQSEISPNIFENNIKKLYEKARGFTDNIAFIGLTKVDESKTSPMPEGIYYSNEIIKKYDKIIEKFCQSRGVYYLPVFDLLSNEELFDGLHPDSKGHRKLFELIKKCLIEKKII